MERFATTPPPPYYAVVFTALLKDPSPGYAEMATRMTELARTMPGFLGMESTRDAEGLGITVSYWTDEPSIARWQREAEHKEAQRQGKRHWYAHYSLRVAKVERAYSGPVGR